MTGEHPVRICRMPYVGLHVRDLDAQVAFYTERWGLNVAQNLGDDVYLNGDAPEHHLLSLHRTGKAGLHHIAFEVQTEDDWGDATAWLEQNGIQLLPAGEGQLAPGVERAVRFTDPEGNLVELVWDVDWSAGSYGKREIKPLGLSHLSLYARDFTRMGAFYRDILGLRLSDQVGEQVSYWRCNQNHHALSLLRGWRSGLCSVGFDVSDWQQLMRGVFVLGEHGVRRLWGPGRHAIGNNLFAYFADPEKNVIEYTCEVEQLEEDWQPRHLEAERALRDQWGSKAPDTLRPSDERSGTKDTPEGTK